MLELKNIKFSFGEIQNFDFSLELENGDSLAIVGPSGSGKTTLLHLIAGFIIPKSGVIKLDNIDYTHTIPSKRPVNMLFQEHNLFSHLKISENIALGINPGLKLKDIEKDKVSNSLERVGLKGFENRFPHQLSGGQRQRVAIARILVRKRPILLLDEPFSFLDPRLREEMLDLIAELHSENRFIMIMVTHDINDGFKVCNKSCYLDGGRIELLCKTKDFIKQAKQMEIRAFLNYVNVTL